MADGAMVAVTEGVDTGQLSEVSPSLSPAVRVQLSAFSLFEYLCVNLIIVK